MKITFASPRYSIAGVPLAQIRFARALAGRCHQVIMLVDYLETDFQFSEVFGLSVRILSKAKVSRMLWSLLLYLRTEKSSVLERLHFLLNGIQLFNNLCHTFCIVSIIARDRFGPAAETAFYPSLD